MYCYIIAFGVALGVRAKTIWKLKTNQSRKKIVKEMNNYIYTERNGSRIGGWRTKRGAIKFIRRVIVQIPLDDGDLVEGRLKMF